MHCVTSRHLHKLHPFGLTRKFTQFCNIHNFVKKRVNKYHKANQTTVEAETRQLPDRGIRITSLQQFSQIRPNNSKCQP